MKSKKLIAGSKKNRLILDLGIHPFADTFIEKKKIKKKRTHLPTKSFYVQTVWNYSSWKYYQT